MQNEPTDDELFRAMIPKDMVGEMTATALEGINKERSEIVASMRRYLEYLNTLMLQDDEWLRARSYLLYLVGQLRSLNATEDTHLQEFFKSSNVAAGITV